MADPEHLRILEQGVEFWNEWREGSEARPRLAGVKLDGHKLAGIDLSEADLLKASLVEADLSGAKLVECDLTRADLDGADLRGADLRRADLTRARLVGAKLAGAKLDHAYLVRADMEGADLTLATIRGATWIRAGLSRAVLRGVELNGASLENADLCEADLKGAKLVACELQRAVLFEANLSGADLRRSDLGGACLDRANLRGANLSEVFAGDASFYGADARQADFREADLSGADLGEAKLAGALLQEADLSRASLVETDLTGADLTGSTVYGVSTWNVELQGTTQEGLVITPEDEQTVTVDSLEVAQFVYLLLKNEKIREVIDTVTSKVVLILGRFSGERKPVLDALREELRRRDYVPVIFDFDKPVDRSIADTVKTLAKLARFVIADVTDPVWVTVETQLIVRDSPTVPFRLIKHESAAVPAPINDLRIEAPPQLIEPFEYRSLDHAVESVEQILEPAEEKVRTIRRKRQEIEDDPW